jgi:Flp pilus assembly protein TadG
MKPGQWKKALAENRGSQIAEAALVMPLTFLIFLGIYSFGRAFNTYATINHAAREGARIAVTQTCGTCGNVAPTAPIVASTVSQTMQASSVDPSKIIAYPSTPVAANCPNAPLGSPLASCTTSGNVTVCNNVPITPAGPYPQVCGVTVTFQYPYQFWLPFTSLNNQQIILTADVQMKGEY